MIDHEPFLVLAARQMHEALSPEETSVVEQHLASCGSCRGLVGAMRRDNALLLEMLAEAPIAPRVRRTVLAAAAGRRRTDPRLVLVLAGLLVIGALGASALVGGGNPAPTASPTSPASSPTPNVAAPPLATPGSSASPAVLGSVNGAYAYTVNPGATRRDSIAASLAPDPVGEWSRMNTATGGGPAFGGPISCLVIDGSDAWMAGPATTASDGSTERSAFLYVHDGGQGGTSDTAVLWMNDPGQTLATMEGWCTSRFIPAGPYPLDEGDVTVANGTSSPATGS